MGRITATIAISAACIVGCDRSPTAATSQTPATEATHTAAPIEKQMHFDHREFVLDLDSSWSALAGNDPEQHQFESKELASTLTISVMSTAIPQAKMNQTAEKLLEFRRKAETETDPTRIVTFGDQ